MLQDLRERNSDPIRDNQNNLLVLKGLLWRHGLAGDHHRDRGNGSSRLGKSCLVYTLLEVTITLPESP